MSTECVICLEDLASSTSEPVIYILCECKRLYCRPCLMKLLDGMSACGSCRKPFRRTRSKGDPIACGRQRLKELTSLAEEAVPQTVVAPQPGELLKLAQKATEQYRKRRREEDNDEASLALAKKLQTEDLGATACAKETDQETQTIIGKIQREEHGEDPDAETKAVIEEIQREERVAEEQRQRQRKEQETKDLELARKLALTDN